MDVTVERFQPEDMHNNTKIRAVIDVARPSGPSPRRQATKGNSLTKQSFGPLPDGQSGLYTEHRIASVGGALWGGSKAIGFWIACVAKDDCLMKAAWVQHVLSNFCENLPLEVTSKGISQRLHHASQSPNGMKADGITPMVGHAIFYPLWEDNQVGKWELNGFGKGPEPRWLWYAHLMAKRGLAEAKRLMLSGQIDCGESTDYLALATGTDEQ